MKFSTFLQIEIIPELLVIPVAIFEKQVLEENHVNRNERKLKN
jgi:hypothetical protein